VVCRLAAMVGKPGKYISMEKGPMAESNPKINMSKDRFLIGFIGEKNNKTIGFLEKSIKMLGKLAMLITRGSAHSSL
jgi:hypothetical protein